MCLFLRLQIMEDLEMMKRFLIFVVIALLTTGAFAQTKSDDYGPSNDHSQCFQVPAPVTSAAHLNGTDFNAGIPASWTVIQNGDNNTQWTTTGSDSCASTGNWASPPGGGGLAACSNTDFTGSSTISDTELITECYDYSGASGSSLSFAANYRNLSAASGDKFEVDYSTREL